MISSLTGHNSICNLIHLWESSIDCMRLADGESSRSDQSHHVSVSVSSTLGLFLAVAWHLFTDCLLYLWKHVSEASHVFKPRSYMHRRQSFIAKPSANMTDFPVLPFHTPCSHLLLCIMCVHCTVFVYMWGGLTEMYQPG